MVVSPPARGASVLHLTYNNSNIFSDNYQQYNGQKSYENMDYDKSIAW